MPRTAVTMCPNLDKILKGNLSTVTKSRDKQMANGQALCLDAVGPLTSILEQGTLTAQSAAEAAQTALKLLGNASCHMATERRKAVLGNLNPRLADIFRDAAPNLFGNGFAESQGKRLILPKLGSGNKRCLGARHHTGLQSGPSLQAV